MSNQKLIEETAQATAQAVVDEMKRKGMVKGTLQTPYQKTETLLYNYMKYKAAVSNKQKEIKTIKAEGLPKKSNSITSYSPGASYDCDTDEEKIEKKIKALQSSIKDTNGYIRMIDNAVNTLKADPYFKIIEMKYLRGMTRDQIATHFGVDATTISRNKNRLINELQITLFPDESISYTMR